MRLDPTAILVVLIALFNAGLAAFVFLRNPRDEGNRIFSLFALSVAIWVPANFFGSNVSSSVLTTVLVKTDFATGVLLANFFFLLANIVGIKSIKSKWLYITTPITMLISALVYGGYVISVTKVPAGAQVGSKLLNTPYELLLVGYLLAGIILLVIKTVRTKGIVRNQVSTILFGLVVAALFTVSTNIVLPKFVQDINVQNFFQHLAYLSLAFLTSACTYAIVKHRLFDVRLVVARTIAYALLLATLGGLYIAGAFGITSLLFNNQKISLGQEAVFVALAIILAFTFQPLRRFFEKITDKIFFRDRYDSQELLNQITQTLASEIDLETILEKTLEMIGQAVRVNFGQYIVFEKGQVYKIEHYGRLPEQVITTAELKNLNQAMLVADELEVGRRKEIMGKHGIRLSLVLRTKDEFVGFLLLGDKLSGDIYSTQDIELFEILANELAVAIVNAKAYEEIAQFNVTLQDKVNQATARLRVANRHLKDLDQAKDEFISMASHQLRTPLTTIKGYISMLQEGDAGKMTGEQKEFLDFAYDGSERMVSLISDLLNVSRMNSGKFMIDTQPVDIVKVISDEVRQLVSHAEAKHLKLIWQPPTTKFPPVELDENKTRQVIMNFIDNAIYYTKAGSVIVSLALAGDRVELRVTDTGIGVPEAARAKLFSKFFRAANAQQARPDGTGLGLFLAKRVIEDQGGQIIFDSVEGKGSTFGFRLPIKATKAPAEPSPAHKPVVKVAVGR